jgi:hypothetical protein
MVSEWSKIATHLRKIKQQSHHERGAKTLFGRINAVLNEVRGSHLQRNVEWRDEAQIEPVPTFADDPLAQSETD